MSPSFCTFFAELHCRNLKGGETIEVCMCVCALWSNTLHLEGVLKLTLREQCFCNVPMRCYLLCQLIFGYSFRQADFWEYFCTQKQGWKPPSITKQLPAPTDSCVAMMLFKQVLFSLGTRSWIRKGIQGSLEYLSRNDHAHWIVFCLWRPQGSCWSKCWICFRLPRVTFPFTDHILPFKFFCQSSFKLKESSTLALSVNRYSQWQQWEVTPDCWRLPAFSFFSSSHISSLILPV